MRILTTISLVAVTAFTHAQISNGGFEDISVDMLPHFWTGDLHVIAITIDTNGVVHTDSVVYDGGTDYALSTDAHSGQYAMELRNGYNFSSEASLIGRLHANSDTVTYQGFPLLNIPVDQRPMSISFWAKYAPLADDSAQVTVTVLDEGENTIGTGQLVFGGAIVQYTAFEVPITYATQDPPAFMRLTFANATDYGTASLGTRLLIDDVAAAFSPEGVNETARPTSALSLFPVPASDQCTVRTADGSPVLAVQVLGADGRVIASPTIDRGRFGTSFLPAGGYVIAARTQAGTAHARLLVVR